MAEMTPAQVATPDAQAADGQHEQEQPKTPLSAEELAAALKKTREEAADYRRKLREAEAREQAAAKAREDAEKAQAEEQGRFRELYEAEQKRAADVEAKLAQMERDQLRRDAAQAVGIPQLWQRLQGETAEALAEDAKALAAMMQPAAGRAATTPPTPQPQPGGPTDFVKQAIERQQKRATENDPYAAMRKR